MKKLVVLTLLGLAPAALAMKKEHLGPQPMDIGQDETITLISNDKQKFMVSVSAALQSETIKNLMADADISKPVPLEYIDGKTLARVANILNRLDGMNPDEVAKLRQFKLSQKQINKQDEFTKSLSYLDVPLIAILETSNGQSFIPLKLALRISFFEGMIPHFGAYNPIPIVQFDGQTMDALVQLLEALEPFLAHNEEVAEAQQIYIPRAYQPEANKILAPLETQQIATLSDAADYFDLPFIQNATGAVIAERISKPIHLTRMGEWRYWNQEERLSSLDSTLCHLNLSIKNLDYLLKHLTLISNGITQEYSIADYIKEHGQPQPADTAFGLTLELSHKKLTSLFGITLLQNMENVQTLELSRNCFFDFTLDPQGATNPFKTLEKLQTLNLSFNELSALHSGWAVGLRNIRKLYLTHNHLLNLQPGWAKGLESLKDLKLNSSRLTDLQAGWGDKLENLEHLDLAWNRLTTLQPGWAKDLVNLKNLGLEGNYLSEEEKAKIKKELPCVAITFLRRIK